MKFAVLILSLAALSSCYSSPFLDLVQEEWQTYKVRFGKDYENTREDALRMKIYMENKLIVANHNQQYYEGQKTFMMELNFFSDLFDHEKSYYKGLVAKPQTSPNAPVFIGPHRDVTLPDSVDWRKEGAVTPVKNQGSCGSCWAFSATGSLEGQHFRKTKKLVSLSEQNLVDCVVSQGSREDCNGGNMEDAFIYIRNNSGIDTEASYPYTAVDGTCNFKKNSVGATDKGYMTIEKGDELALKQAVALIGPISVGIDASHNSFQNYKEGVYYEPSCSHAIDHGVLVVGYGTTEEGIDYWLVKNSWGEDWGMDGYIKMARNRNNNCDIATDASYPIV